MLYIGYLIILDGQSIKKPVPEISIFELPRLENCISRLCPRPLGSPPPPPPQRLTLLLDNCCLKGFGTGKMFWPIVLC